MRVVFMGTADFALPALTRLHQSPHDIVMVYTQPPRPAGRGKKEQLTPVHALATELGLPVATPASLKPADVKAAFADLDSEIGIVAAYGLLLPQAILEAPTHGCLNLHGSLLPRWRGAAPVERAILAGDPETGIGIFQMEPGLDTGPVFAERRLELTGQETGPDLRQSLAELAASALLPVLDGIEAGTANAVPQPEDGVTYAHKLDKAEYRLDWSQPATEVERAIRAFHPFAWFEHDGDRVRVLAADILDGGQDRIGTVVDDQLTIACREGQLRPTIVQPSGKKPMPTDAYLRGHAVPAGTRLF